MSTYSTCSACSGMEGAEHVCQIDRADLAGMTPQQIDEAHRAGRLDAVLGVPSDDTDVVARAKTGEFLNADDVAALRRMGHNNLITTAYDRGRILTNIQPEENA